MATFMELTIFTIYIILGYLILTKTSYEAKPATTIDALL